MPERIVAVFAHPDDESLLVGGTLAACAQAGHEVGVISLTRGELGPIAEASGASRETLGEVRAGELEAAARELGATWALCLEYPDGELQDVPPETAARDLAGRLAVDPPQALLTFSSEGLYWHPDHVAAHAIVGAAAARLGTPLLYGATWPDGLAARVADALERPDGLWGLDPAAFGAPEDAITTIIDVTPFLDAKLRGLRCHRTQLDRDHLLSVLPREDAARLLGREYYVRERADPSTGDWLLDTVRRA